MAVTVTVAMVPVMIIAVLLLMLLVPGKEDKLGKFDIAFLHWKRLRYSLLGFIFQHVGANSTDQGTANRA